MTEQHQNHLYVVANDSCKASIAEIFERYFEVINVQYSLIAGTDGTVDIAEKFFGHKQLVRFGHAAKGDVVAAYMLQHPEEGISVDWMAFFDTNIEPHQPYKLILMLELIACNALWLSNPTIASYYFQTLQR